MKRPEIEDPEERSQTACVTVSEVFRARPWYVNLWETERESSQDHAGYDMYVIPQSGFLESFFLDSVEQIPVQIKSGDKRVKEFVRKYMPQGRFFGFTGKYHQFVLCGMDDHDLVLADLVGQMVAHGQEFGVSEEETLKKFVDMGDIEAYKAYKKFKVVLLFKWYANRLPPL